MADSVETMLSNAKKTLSDAQQKFPTPSTPPKVAQPTYSQAHAARKQADTADELKATGEMMVKGQQALKQ